MQKDWDEIIHNLKTRIKNAHESIDNKRPNSHTDIVTRLVTTKSEETKKEVYNTPKSIIERSTKLRKKVFDTEDES